jgi:hypothetical protein
MDTSRYPKACYNMLVSLDDAGKVTWATHIKTLLYHFGFGYVGISHEVGNAQHVCIVFTQRIHDCYFQEWCANKGASSKLLLYNELTLLRFCQLCLKQNIYVVEDEFHFVAIYPTYTHLRSTHFLHKISATHFSFVNLLSMQNPHILNHLATLYVKQSN